MLPHGNAYLKVRVTASQEERDVRTQKGIAPRVKQHNVPLTSGSEIRYCRVRAGKVRGHRLLSYLALQLLPLLSCPRFLLRGFAFCRFCLCCSTDRNSSRVAHKAVCVPGHGHYTCLGCQGFSMLFG